MQEKICSLGKEVGNATGKPSVCQAELQAAILSPKYHLALLGLRHHSQKAIYQPAGLTLPARITLFKISGQAKHNSLSSFFFFFPLFLSYFNFLSFPPETVFRNVIVFISTYSTNPITWHIVKKPHENATTNAQNLFMIIKKFTYWIGERTVFSLLHLSSFTLKHFSKE